LILKDDLLYQIALTLVHNIGDVQAKALINHFGDANSVFKAKKKELENVEGVRSTAISSIKEFENFKRAEEEISFIEKYKIKPLFLTDKDYPKKLLNCYDSPTLLYYRGNADLNTSKVLGIVGTRSCSAYGKAMCEKLISELEDENILVVSGLALGIDSIAHKGALKNNIKTVGVLAHGLDHIYPPENKSLAKQMTNHGGVITEFLSNTKREKGYFPKRNRIVAGMCDAVVVMESSIKGGSLITAELANGYNKDVFAFPGKANDSKSEGCNFLIKTNKAALVTSAEDVLESMGWKEQKKKIKKQRELFIEFSNEEKIIFDILNQQENIHIDELYLKSNLSSSTCAAALLTLEMQGVVSSLPGKLYKLA